MIASKIFEENYKTIVEDRIRDLLNSDFDVSRIEQQWAIGNFLTDHLDKIIGNSISECSLSLARRAMADLAFSDRNGFYYVVDVKTHRLDSIFNMPNFTSSERLSRFYEDDSNYFVILKIGYLIEKSVIKIEDVTFVPITIGSCDY